ncbi:hypothetical protein E2C01_086249 [Portunus trituberculatus]|uniref:Uncharacterized protein n=1 Tax=Portunus trituberculatus TaxID=210409 RepID=A0A5B7J956_PORTR|nr:hypothetical protein [Portunus trituberculatus]
MWRCRFQHSLHRTNGEWWLSKLARQGSAQLNPGMPGVWSPWRPGGVRPSFATGKCPPRS